MVGERLAWLVFASSLQVQRATALEHAAASKRTANHQATSPHGCMHSRTDGRIFNLGWHKTGTTSFIDSMQKLGFHSVHNVPHRLYPRFMEWYRALLSPGRNISASLQEYILKGLLSAEAFADMPYILDAVWPYLAELFPTSRFVLVERDESAWVASLLGNFRLMTVLPSHNTPWERWVTSIAYNVSVGRNFWPLLSMLCNGNSEPFVRAYRDHNSKVRAFFSSLPPERTLILQTHELSNTTKLAKFLGCSAIANGSQAAPSGSHSNSAPAEDPCSPWRNTSIHVLPQVRNAPEAAATHEPTAKDAGHR